MFHLFQIRHPPIRLRHPAHYSSDEEYITVTLDRVRPAYEHNPKTRNPNFEMIKEVNPASWVES